MSKINLWINSGQYKSQIDEVRTEIMKQCKLSDNESTTASIFEHELYFLIRAKTGLKINIIKEQKVDCVNHTFGLLANRKSGTGRIDAVVNNLIIEYKHNSKLNSQEQFKLAANQVKDYLIALYNNENIKYEAILTDGIRISYFGFTGDDVNYTDLYSITNDDIDTIVKAILSNNQKKFVAKNVLNDFSINSHYDSCTKKIARYLFDVLLNKKTSKTEMLYKEWKELMHLSVEDNGKGNDIKKRRDDLSAIFEYGINDNDLEYMSLYALQTTYAIVVKLIACKVIDRLNYNEKADNYYDLSTISSDELQNFFEKMEDGYSYRNNDIVNFLEGDFFSWYSDKNQWSYDFFNLIVEVIKLIDGYSAFTFNIKYEPIDIFKDLYMSIIPRSIRHSMGEYFTPEWLADYVISNALIDVNNPKWRAIDPCCGSGIFVVNLIKHIVGDRMVNKLSPEEKMGLKTEILSRVYGIDINPLSVLSARVGYFLALKPFGDLQNIEIPVFLGDSAILAQKIKIDDIDCYNYSINNLKEPFNITLPIRYVKQKEFSKIMNELQACVKTDDWKILYDVMVEKLTENERSSTNLLKEIKKLSKSLTYLHSQKYDGIWIRIATNFMQIARLDEFDLIVGNPPWVKWEHLPSTYANRIKEVCDIKHIFSGAGQFGGTQLNICALISNVTATNWLAKNGVLAFLMPDSIMSQNSYEGFRNFYLNYETGERLFLSKIDRWKAPLRPFRADDKVVTQDFNTYYYSRKYVDYSVGFTVKEISRVKNIKDDKLNEYKSFDAVKKYLIFTDGFARQLSNNTTAFSYTSNIFDYSKIIGSTSYLYRTGVEFTPQELYMLVGKGKSNCSLFYRFENKKFMLSKYVIDDMPTNGWKFETSIIYPIVTGPSITPFNYENKNEFAIVPYDATNTSEPISTTEMMSKNKKIMLYLMNHKKIIDMQSEKSKMMHRGSEFYSLSKIGPYTFADYIVAARDNSKFCATVVKNGIAPWGERKNSICVKHTIIISQRVDKSFITEDESYYICGILNSSIVKNYMESSFKSNGYSLNKANIYLPLYNKDDIDHVEIVKLAKIASSDKDADIPKIQHQITTYYLKICEKRHS